jgi:hypothetical protein
MIKSRKEFPKLLKEFGLMGPWVELGVGNGNFHQILAQHNDQMYGVDKWNDRHNLQQYLNVLRKVGRESTIIRATFEKALPLFPDGFFDFIYIDGYARQGQEDGKTIRDWFPKLKQGGVYAGHDYYKRFPKTIEQVDLFLKSISKFNDLQLTYSDEYPSWWIKLPP